MYVQRWNTNADCFKKRRTRFSATKGFFLKINIDNGAKSKHLRGDAWCVVCEDLIVLIN
jgi:hypothetical protein